MGAGVIKRLARRFSGTAHACVCVDGVCVGMRTNPTASVTPSALFLVNRSKKADWHGKKIDHGSGFPLSGLECTEARASPSPLAPPLAGATVDLLGLVCCENNSNLHGGIKLFQEAWAPVLSKLSDIDDDYRTSLMAPNTREIGSGPFIPSLF